MVYVGLCILEVTISSSASGCEEKRALYERTIDAPGIRAALSSCLCTAKSSNSKKIFGAIHLKYSPIAIIIEYCMSTAALYATITQIPAGWFVEKETAGSDVIGFRARGDSDIRWHVPLGTHYKARQTPSRSFLDSLHNFDLASKFFDQATGWIIQHNRDTNELSACTSNNEFNQKISIDGLGALRLAGLQKAKEKIYLYVIGLDAERRYMRRDMLPSSNNPVYRRGHLITDLEGMLTTCDILRSCFHQGQFKLYICPHDSDYTLASGRLVHQEQSDVPAQQISVYNDYVVFYLGQRVLVYYFGNDPDAERQLVQRGDDRTKEIPWSAGYYRPHEAMIRWASAMACMGGMLLGDTFLAKEGPVVRSCVGLLMGTIMGGATICATGIWPDNYMTQRILQPLERWQSPAKYFFSSATGLIMLYAVSYRVAGLVPTLFSSRQSKFEKQYGISAGITRASRVDGIIKK